MSLSPSSTVTHRAAIIKQTNAQPKASTDLICRRVMAATAWHSLLWLVVANSVGVLLATMLLVPQVNNLLGQWTYGHWMPVHVNLQLYGWCSLPLVAFLFKVYGSDRERVGFWCRPVLWVWSCALGIGALSWLNGHSSGKLFLDWVGYPRVLFPMAPASLWMLLSYSLVSDWKHAGNSSLPARILKMIGLVLLLLIPFLIYFAASPAI